MAKPMQFPDTIWAWQHSAYLYFGLVGLRVPKRVEEEGLDLYEHGETAYNL